MAIITASDPELPEYDSTLPRYDIKSPAFAKFPDAVKQLSGMGQEATAAASHLAHAIAFPRQDSYLAAQALLTLGPTITGNTIPTLLNNLQSQKTEARAYSLILLGSVGIQASCTMEEIAPLLWDSEPSVRSAAALAMEKIIGHDLVSSEYEIVITPSFQASSIMADAPEGRITGIARTWWTKQGSKINWHTSYSLCDA
jgi:hypothetical protein